MVDDRMIYLNVYEWTVKGRLIWIKSSSISSYKGYTCIDEENSSK